MFRGIYNGSKKHEEDLKNVVERAKAVGVEKVIFFDCNYCLQNKWIFTKETKEIKRCFRD